MRNTCFTDKQKINFISYRISYRFLKILFCIQVIVFSTIVSANQDWTVTNVSPQLSIWFQDWQGSQSEAAEQINHSFERLREHWLFQGRLPAKIAVLVDGDWTKTAGYWSSTLAAPDGTPAVLLAPNVSREVLADPAENLKILAHELTHLIHYKIRPQEQSWVREGLALLAEYLVTGYFNPSLPAAFSQPETSLVADLDPGRSEEIATSDRLAQYGHLVQYFYYIYRLCGKNQLFLQLLTSDSAASGKEFLDESLRIASAQTTPNPACTSFEESFRFFELARFIDDPLAPETYVVHVPLKSRLQPNASFTLPPYSAGAYSLKGAKAKCQPTEMPWGSARCIRVREQ